MDKKTKAAENNSQLINSCNFNFYALINIYIVLGSLFCLGAIHLIRLTRIKQQTQFVIILTEKEEQPLHFNKTSKNRGTDKQNNTFTRLYLEQSTQPLALTLIYLSILVMLVTVLKLLFHLMVIKPCKNSIWKKCYH